MKNKTAKTKRTVYPAYVELEEGLVLYYAVDIRDDEKYAIYMELEAENESKCEDVEEACIQITNPETARKLAYGLNLFADAMEGVLEDEEAIEYEEEENEDEEDEEEYLGRSLVVKNKKMIRKLEDMGIIIGLEDDGSAE